MSQRKRLAKLRPQPLFPMDASDTNAKANNDLNRSPVRFGVIGIGGGGCNAVESMARFPWSDDIDFACVETDVQKLRSIPNQEILQLQLESALGQGAGMIPDNGRRAAEKSRPKLEQLLQNYQAVFLVSGMGGGTGTGATPMIADYARAMGLLVVGVVTKPFSWENDRIEKAQRGIDLLKEKVDSLIVISNEKVEECYPGSGYKLALSSADNVLSNAVRSITNLVIRPGEINIDFADICHVLRSSKDNRLSLIGFGDSRDVKEPENDLLEKTVELAIENPILEAYSLEGCTGLLINITTNSNTAFVDLKAINSFMQEKLAGKTATNGFVKKTGFVIDDELDDGVIQITVVAAGVSQSLPEDDELMEDDDLLPIQPNVGVANMQVHRNPNPPAPEPKLDADKLNIGMNSHGSQQASSYYQLASGAQRQANTPLRKRFNILSTREFVRAAAEVQHKSSRDSGSRAFFEKQLN